MDAVLAEMLKLYELIDYPQANRYELERRINTIIRFASETNSMVALFENLSDKPIYLSDEYRLSVLDKYGVIHPDDCYNVINSLVILLYYIKSRNLNFANYKLIGKYRAKLKGTYFVVIENLRSFESDSKGKPLLYLVMLDIAASQTIPYAVEFKLLNLITGEVIIPSEELYLDNDSVRTSKEIINQFYQADKSDFGQYGGFGLGHEVIKKMMDMLN
jgi:hypothetical protein